VIQLARKMGIDSKLEPNPSLAIGTSEVIPLELVSAFSVYPNGGVHIAPRYITKVVDRYGNVLEENPATQRESSVLSPAIAYIATNVMESVMNDSGGTAVGARSHGFRRAAAGKTGTSDDFCDAWFVGFTPQFTAGCWIGFDDKTSIGDNQTGSRNSLPVWTDFMIAAHENLPEEYFVEPQGVKHEIICVESGKKASDACDHIRDEVFLEEFLITEICPLHGKGRRR
jgi:penicillin-binding protein 1A